MTNENFCGRPRLILARWSDFFMGFRRGCGTIAQIVAGGSKQMAMNLTRLADQQLGRGK
jgi:hypothetical protein